MLDKRTQQEVNDLFNAAYDELRRLAASIKRERGGITISPTGLVNQAWVKLSRSKEFEPGSLGQFKGLAARAMKQVLFDEAGRAHAQKRGGGPGEIFVTFEEAVHRPITSSRELLALKSALDELAGVAPRQAEIVDRRFFGGMEIAEIAAEMDVAKSTVEREWRAARAWLAHRVRAES
jgi:RNA polymerase sigma factor (TIGR02999 family)